MGKLYIPNNSSLEGVSVPCYTAPVGLHQRKEFPVDPTVLAAIIGIGGIIVGGLLTHFLGKLDGSPKIIVVISSGGFIFPNGSASSFMFLLSVTNDGNKTVKISSAELVWNKNRLFLIGMAGQRELPFDLGPDGDSVQMWMPMDDLRKVLKSKGISGTIQAKGCFKDTAGREYYSKQKWSINVDA